MFTSLPRQALAIAIMATLAFLAYPPSNAANAAGSYRAIVPQPIGGIQRSPVLSNRGLMVETRAIQLQRAPYLMSDPRVLMYLGDAMSPRERAVMYAVLSEIPVLRNRVNVVYFSSDGVNYSNRRVLARTAWQSETTPLADTGCGRAGVNTLYYCGFFHRKYSDNYHDFTDVQFDVNLPCATSRLASTADAAYILGGGRQLDANGNSKFEEDAGLQGVGYPTSIQNFMTATGQKTVSGGAGHFVCDQADVQVHTYSLSNTELGLSSTGNTKELGYTTLTTVLAMQYIPSCQTPPNATTCQVKRETSLAKRYPTETFPDGSFVGVNSPLGSPSPSLQFRNVMLGTTNNLSLWTETESEDCPASPPQLLDAVQTAYQETVGIDAAIGISTTGCMVVQTHK